MKNDIIYIQHLFRHHRSLADIHTFGSYYSIVVTNLLGKLSKYPDLFHKFNIYNCKAHIWPCRYRNIHLYRDTFIRYCCSLTETKSIHECKTYTLYLHILYIFRKSNGRLGKLECWLRNIPACKHISINSHLFSAHGDWLNHHT